jgi:hypothetical protein
MDDKNGKDRLNLTVLPDFKEKAAELASKRRRSISALFEDLIDEEWKREKKKRKTHD